MLFLWKRTLAQIVVITGVLVGLSLGLKFVFDIEWVLEWRAGHVRDFLVALAVILASDFGSHAVIGSGSVSYRASYRALVEHFSPHRVPHFLATGLAAAAEEMFFRGVILEGLRRLDEWRRFRRDMGGLGSVPNRLDRSDEDLIMQALAPTHRLILSRVNGVRSVDDIVRDTRRPVFDVYKALSELRYQRLVTLVKEPS